MNNESKNQSTLMKVLAKLEWMTENILYLILVAMVLVVFAEVIMRYVFNSSITAAEEVARMLFVWLVYIGAMLAMVHDKHVAFDAIQQAVSPGIRKIMRLASYVCIAVATFILAKYGWDYCVMNFTWPSAATGIPYGYIALIVPISGAVMLVTTVVKFVQLLMTKEEK